MPKVELVQIHRQARSNGITQIAHAVRHGVLPCMTDFTGCACGVNFIDAADDGIIESLLRVLTEWSGCDDVQILAVINGGSTGVCTSA